MVALYHNLLAFYAVAFLGTGAVMASIANTHFEKQAYGNPLMVFLSGTFAVAIFFVLSGFVLSIGYFQTGNESIIRKLATKRYLRLMLPALASVLICYALIKFGLNNASAAAAFTHSGWLGPRWGFEPHLLGAIVDAAWGIFIKSGSIYNNVLWTMSFEFVGSFIVFGSLLLFGKSQRRWILYVCLIFLTWNTWFLAFVAGMILADMTAGGFIQSKARKLWQIVPLIVLGLFLGGYPLMGATGTIYDHITPNALIGRVNFISIYTTIGATILVTLTVACAQITRLLKSKYMSELGAYTFSLYLVHIPILFSFTTFAFLHLHNHFGYNTSVLLSLAASIPIVAGATYLFRRFVDTPAIKFSGYIASMYLENKELPIKLQKLIRLARRRVQRFARKLRLRPDAEMLGEELAE